MTKPSLARQTPLAARPGRLAALPKPLFAALLTAALLGAAPTSAHAGTYALVGCADLAGALTPAHVSRPADGWFLEQGVYPSRQECAAGRHGLGIYATAGLGADLFRLNAPAHTTVARLVLTYRAHLSGAEAWAVPTFVVEAGHRGSWEYVGPARGSISGAPIDFGGARVSADAHDADALRIGVRCELLGPCVKGGQPAASFSALAVVLRDDRAPDVGLALPERHVRGAVEVALRASDEGGGVFERALAVDGRRLTGGPLCPTVPASVGPIRHVVRRVPCPLDAPVRVPLDTRTLTDGSHTLRARVEDVAGNARSAEAPIVVDNLPPTAGTVTLAGEAAVSEALTAVPSGFAGQDVAYEYGWERCSAEGDACRAIGGAVSRTYPLRSADRGHRVRAVVVATDGGGSVKVSSTPSDVVPDLAVAAPPPPPPSSSPSAPSAGAPAGRLTAWLERGRVRLRRTTVRWPARVRIRGRLTDLAGQALARTPVRMLERVDGRRWRAITGVRTRRDGRLTTFAKIGPSRWIRLAYGSSAVTLRVRVRASARVRVRHTGSVTIVSGRLLGGRVPRAGVRVWLQTRGGARWSTRAVLRTDGLGRFSATGRAASRIRLRIVIPAQRGYPFARGVAAPRTRRAW